jgi:hypothetical protein
MDTVLSRVSDEVKTRFIQTVDSSTRDLAEKVAHVGYGDVERGYSRET